MQTPCQLQYIYFKIRYLFDISSFTTLVYTSFELTITIHLRAFIVSCSYKCFGVARFSEVLNTIFLKFFRILKIKIKVTISYCLLIWLLLITFYFYFLFMFFNFLYNVLRAIPNSVATCDLLPLFFLISV